MQIVQARGRQIPIETRAKRLSPTRAHVNRVSKIIPANDMPTPALSDEPYAYAFTREMRVRDWIDIRDNPQQRDVAVRIAKGRTTHLKKFDQSHRKVIVGILPDGDLVKIDAHTRAFYWRHQLSDRSPETVIAEFWHCNDIEAAKSLYDKIDNPLTGEYGSDIITGSARDHGVTFESKILKDGEISTAIRELWTYIFAKSVKRDQRHEVMRESFSMFIRELETLDRIITTKVRFRTPTIMAALLTLKIEPGAEAFWKAYADGDMVKINQTRDAVAVFDDKLPTILRKQSNYVRQREVMAYAISGIKAFNKRQMYSMERGYQIMDAVKLRKYINAKFGAN